MSDDDDVKKTYRLLESSKVHAVIGSMLKSGGYPKHRLDDGVRDVVEKVYVYLDAEKITVDSEDRMCAIVVGKAWWHGADAKRVETGRGRTMVGMTDAPDDHAAQSESVERALDLKRALEYVGSSAKPEDLALLQGLAAGKKPGALSEELNLSRHQVYRRTEEVRARTRTLLKAAGYGGIIASLAAVAWLGLREMYGPDRGAQNGPPIAPSVPSLVPSAPPAPETAIPVDTQGIPIAPPDSVARAAQLRAIGLAAFKKRDYVVCHKAYDEAMKLDPRPILTDSVENDRYNACERNFQSMPNSKQ